MKTDITVIILTKNEEANIERCINSVKGWGERVVVLDSGSTDRTIELAEYLGAEVYNHEPFENHGKQFNWALDNLQIKTNWVFRIDADEVVPTDLAEEIIQKCQLHSTDDVNAFEMRFKVFFLDRFLKYGGAYPFCKINIFKYSKARFNERPLGDNVELKEGQYIQLQCDCLHYDFKSLSAFVRKHDWYADLEVCSYYRQLDSIDANISKAAKIRKAIRNNVYYKLPRYLRAKFYYWYILYCRLGFLDGEAGYVYAFIKSYFYRFLVDAKIYEQELLNKKK